MLLEAACAAVLLCALASFASCRAFFRSHQAASSGSKPAAATPCEAREASGAVDASREGLGARPGGGGSTTACSESAPSAVCSSVSRRLKTAAALGPTGGRGAA